MADRIRTKPNDELGRKIYDLIKELEKEGFSIIMAAVKEKATSKKDSVTLDIKALCTVGKPELIAQCLSGIIGKTQDKRLHKFISLFMREFTLQMIAAENTDSRSN